MDFKIIWSKTRDNMTLDRQKQYHVLIVMKHSIVFYFLQTQDNDVLLMIN